MNGKQLWNKLTALIPGPLPVGMAQYKTWADSILDLAGRFADEDSLQFALAAMVVNSGAKAWRSKNYFVQGLRKSATNQLASGIMYDIKQKQKEREAAKAAAQNNPKNLAEATAPQVASNGIIQNPS